MTLGRPIARGLFCLALLASAARGQPVLFVDADAPAGGDGSTWEAAFCDLQDALAAAAGSGGLVTQVWVAAGTYRPDRGTHDRNLSFPLVSGVALYGGFAGDETNVDARDPATHVTVLSGDLLANDGPNFTNVNDNSYHVVTAADVDGATALDGFQLQGGNASDLGGINSVGGGLAALGGSPLIRACRFVRNRASFGGGLYAHGGQPLLAECVFEGNAAVFSAGGVFNHEGNEAVFVRCRFVANAAGMQAGALACGLDCTNVLLNCGFYGNTSGYFGAGAVLVNNSAATFVNCVFSGNAANGGAHGGGGLRNERGQCDLANCTFYGNSAATGGGVFNFLVSSTSLTNCVLWANTGASGADEGGQLAGDTLSPALDDCCVQGWTGQLGGQRNFGREPRFLNPPGDDQILGTPDDDLRLVGCESPCVNTGNAAALPADVWDLDHDDDACEPLPTDFGDDERVHGGRVDRGAYEFVGVPDMPGDFDCDADVDALDFVRCALCLNGPENLDPPAAADLVDFVRADLQGDGDVDQADLAQFQLCFTGDGE